MPKRMLINATDREESRVAVLDEQGQVENLIVETSAKGQIKGNIYKAVIVNVDTGLEAAFIEYGSNRHGFLPLHDIHPKYYNSKEELSPNKIQENLKKGTELLVQAEREEVMHKGAVFTTYLSLPGRFMVIMPESSGGGISRKIENENDRKYLRETLKLLKEDNDDIGIIIRTAGVGHDDQSLKDDYQNLVNDYKNILNGFKRKRGTGLIYEDMDLTIRSIRDYFSKDINEVYVDNYQVYKKSIEFFRRFMPEHINAVKHYRDKRPLFSRFNVETQIEQMYERLVPLPSGGSICIDPTEALISIDVNSGSAKSEEGQEMLAFQTNVEASVEIARQLRLRNLGGLIVIDFIDMNSHKHRRIVERVIQTVIKKDKARIETSPIGKFGLLEMSRQRIKANLGSISKTVCTHCNGRGFLRAVPIAGMAALRKATDLALTAGQNGEVRIEAPPSITDYLLNEKRSAILKIEQTFNISVHVIINPHILPGFEQFHVLSRKQLEDEEKKNAIAKERYERSQSKGTTQYDRRSRSKSIWKYNDNSIEAKELPPAIQELLNDHYYEITNQKPPAPVVQPSSPKTNNTPPQDNQNRKNRKRPDRTEERFEYLKESFDLIQEEVVENIAEETEILEPSTFEIYDELAEKAKKESEKQAMKLLAEQETQEIPSDLIKQIDTGFQIDLHEASPEDETKLDDENSGANNYQTIETDEEPNISKTDVKQTEEILEINGEKNNSTLKSPNPGNYTTTTISIEEDNVKSGVEFIDLNKTANNFGAGLIEEEKSSSQSNESNSSTEDDTDSDLATVTTNSASNDKSDLEETIEKSELRKNHFHKGNHRRSKRRGNNRRSSFRKRN